MQTELGVFAATPKVIGSLKLKEVSESTCRGYQSMAGRSGEIDPN